MDKFSHTDQCLLADSTASMIETENPGRSLILTINGGSSSLKFAFFERINSLPRVLSGRVERIGMGNSRWIVKWTDSGREEDRAVDAPDQNAAVQRLIEWIEQSIGFTVVKGVGHRIVYGGGTYHQPEILTAEMIDELRKLSPCDPDHLPGEVESIEAFRSFSPELTQVACFDTAFHHNMPRVAQIVPIPRRFEAIGVRRYGFHGLSYEYLMEELTRIAGPDEARGRIILAHLGAGASLAAVHNHHSIDTTMGFTPASGLIMGTRSGDIDPGLVRFLLTTEKMTAEQFDSLINRESGLRGVSETSSDVRDLLSIFNEDVRAAEAIELFCYQAKKGIGAYAAALGGVETLVFSGGIGENSPEIRQRICDGMQFLGIELDISRNDANADLISTEASRVKVRVIRTDEERMIARSVLKFLNPTTAAEVVHGPLP